MFAYVGCYTTRERQARGEGISVYRVAPASGEWAHVQLVPRLVNPSFLAVDPSGRCLYSVHGDEDDVTAFAIDGDSGHLAFRNRRKLGGRNGVHLSVAPTGRFLRYRQLRQWHGFAAAVGGRRRARRTRHAFGAAGRARPAPGAADGFAAPCHPVRSVRRFVYAANEASDTIVTFRIDPRSGTLDPTGEVIATASPASIVFAGD